MNRLAWKLFLAFWATLLVFTGLVLYASSSYLDIASSNDTDGGDVYGKTIAAQAIADAKGIEGLRRWANDEDDTELTALLVIDVAGQDLLGRNVPPRVLTHLRQHQQAAILQEKQNAELGTLSTHQLPRQRRSIKLADGQEFWLIRDSQSARLSRLISRPRSVILELTLATLIGAIASYLLAKYLTRPLELLRRATARYAQGDFSQRVTPALRGRSDEIAELATAQDHMAEQIQALINSQSLLLRDISHELRSPLARAAITLGLARKQLPNDNSAELDRCESELERLNELLGQMLSFSRLESGVGQLNVVPVDLAKLLSQIVSRVEVEADAKHCAICLDTDTSIILNADNTLLSRAFENVLRNAIRFTPENRMVTITLTKEKGNRCAVTVLDQGPGIPDEMLDRVFEPFVRVDLSRDNRSGGVGLGLAIASRAVMAHGGSIFALNQPEGGLAVVISLPTAS